MLAGQRTEVLGRGPGNGFGEVKVIHRLRLAEIGRIVQLLKDDELCAAIRHVGNSRRQTQAIILNGGRAGLLNESEFHRVENFYLSFPIISEDISGFPRLTHAYLSVPI